MQFAETNLEVRKEIILCVRSIWLGRCCPWWQPASLPWLQEQVKLLIHLDHGVAGQAAADYFAVAQEAARAVVGATLVLAGPAVEAVEVAFSVAVTELDQFEISWVAFTIDLRFTGQVTEARVAHLVDHRAVGAQAAVRLADTEVQAVRAVAVPAVMPHGVCRLILLRTTKDRPFHQVSIRFLRISKFQLLLAQIPLTEQFRHNRVTAKPTLRSELTKP